MKTATALKCGVLKELRENEEIAKETYQGWLDGCGNDPAAVSDAFKAYLLHLAEGLAKSARTADELYEE